MINDNNKIKLSVSNIAWQAEDDEAMYKKIADSGFEGLEIAPSRIFGSQPYDNTERAKEWACKLNAEYGLVVSSMQSIWYGRSENIFRSKDERDVLEQYTFKAIDFAEAISCENLVFGCPKNRNLESNAQLTHESAIELFKTVGDYASEHGTTISLEANPAIYGTNYLNTLKQVCDVLAETGTKGLAVNLDFGAIIYNNEAKEESIEDSLEIVKKIVPSINHVHISEPHLRMIKQRKEHKTLFQILISGGYSHFVSIEIGNGAGTLSDISSAMNYVKELSIKPC